MLVSDIRTEAVEYVCNLFAKEDYLLNNILARQEEDGGPMMHIGADQGKFINLLIKLTKPKSILEVGSYYGYSTVWIARALRELENGKLTCIEKSKKHIEIIQEHLSQDQLEGHVEVYEGSGIDLMEKFISEGISFDMIFIDADKGNYPNYLKLSAKLLPRGGLLLVDNCLWGNRVLESAEELKSKDDKQTLAIKEFNEKLASHPDFESSIITIHDGMAFAIKK